MDTFEKAKAFVYRNARPLDLARFRFHFENGSIDDVLHALSFYQNDDGGFAYAIEPDNWNINSNPIGAWAAAMILREIGFTDTEHPIMKGLLNYLDSGKDFSGGKWYNTVAGNNDYPHAVWWECDDPEGIPSDNPTVSLAGFALCFADKNSSIYQKAGGIAKKAVRNFLQNPTDEPHTFRCFSDLLGYCEEIEGFDVFDLKTLRESVISRVNDIICSDTERWTTDYVCTPSFFFFKNNRIFKTINRDLCKREVEMIYDSQLEDGSYPVVWKWHNDYREFEISANWWKSDIIIRNMQLFREFGIL